jgi:hypothetical protein
LDFLTGAVAIMTAFLYSWTNARMYLAVGSNNLLYPLFALPSHY